MKLFLLNPRMYECKAYYYVLMLPLLAY